MMNQSIMAIAKDTVIKLSAEEVPKKWYNIAADLKNLQPMINPATREPGDAANLLLVFHRAVGNLGGHRLLQLLNVFRADLLDSPKHVPLWNVIWNCITHII